MRSAVSISGVTIASVATATLNLGGAAEKPERRPPAVLTGCLHSKLGGRTPAEIAGQRGWGYAPKPVAITSTISHQSKGLYF